MDKIQELHFEACLFFESASREAPKHATITEDMMGRFAEWVTREYWVISTIDGKMYNLTTEQIATMPELIQLFKETL